MPPSHPLALKYLYGGIAHCRPGQSLGPRDLPDYELVLVIVGQVTYQVGKATHHARPGSVILARPGFHETYFWGPDAMTRHAYVHFDIEHMPDDWPPAAKWPVLYSEPNPVIGPMFRHLIELIVSHPEWPATSPGAEACRFLECLMDILLRPVRKSRSAIQHQIPEPVQRVLGLMRQILDDEPRRAVELHHFAKRAGVTEKHLCRLFQNALGHSPMKTFRLLKLQLALALLGRSNLAIKEIADRCGFENPLYFTRCFTQTYGKSPSLTRASLLDHQTPPPNPLPPEITPRIYW